MKRNTLLVFALLLSSSLFMGGCHRRPFNHRNRHRASAAEKFLTRRYRKPVNEIPLYSLLEALTDEFTQFFDSASNKESFDVHVKRMNSFRSLLSNRLVDEDVMRKDFEDHIAEYQTEFSRMIDFESFRAMIIEIMAYYHVMCEELNAQLESRSSLAVCKTFYTFYKKLPMSFLKRITPVSTSNFSQYWMWRTIRWRLSLKN